MALIGMFNLFPKPDMKLKEHLKDRISEEELRRISNRFSIIGDVAVTSIPPGLECCKKDISSAIISRHHSIKTVLNKTTRLEGDRRVPGFELLQGERTITAHREFGFVYRLDVSKVFFNSHLGYERNRVASKARPGEKALVPFCGVGPFVVPIAAKGSAVFAIEANPEACRWLAENIKINKVEDRVAMIKGDAFKVHKMLKVQFDRAVIPTPYGRDEILETISPLIKPGGTAHFYTFKKRHQIEGLIKKYRSLGFQVEFFRSCGNVAPGVCRWAFDMIKL